MKKIILCLLAVECIMSFCSCSSVKPARQGEVYVKTSPSVGDSGVTEVIDISLEKSEYESKGDITVPVSVGVGHLPVERKYEGDEYAYLKISIWINAETPSEKPDSTVRYTYEDWHDDKFDSTKQKKVLFGYGEFYPLHLETVNVTIPAHAQSGRISAVLYLADKDQEKDEYTYHTNSISVSFVRDGDKIIFSAEN